jgi:CheY-like chemotaxis protein
MGRGALGKIEYGSNASVLVLADSEAGVERATRAAELAGCRISAIATVDAGLARLERQAGLDAVLLDLQEDHGEPLDRLLHALDQAAEAGRYGSVVATPASVTRPMLQAPRHERVQHLCAPEAPDLAAALGRATSRPRHWLHDAASEQDQPALHELSEEVRRIAGLLESLSEDDGKGVHAPKGADGPRRSEACKVRAIIRARRARDQFFPADLFADPAWDILLDLFAAHLENQRVAVSSLCIAAAVPATTALRWIKTLTDQGLLIRSADPQDGRRVYIELAPDTAGQLEAYLAAAQRISPHVL